MSISSVSTSSSSSSSTTVKKTRRFSLVRLFSSNNNNSSSNGSTSPISISSLSSTLNDVPYRHSMDPKSSSVDTMQTEIMRERRKSIATLTNNASRSMSLDFRTRPLLGSRKEAAPQEMNEKMRQFDEMLQTRKATIRITLTPSLLQEP
ncbi:hypothetical protein FBU30_009412 [Linnemannia zychae]|nr:hypothetical protein FBU30_009412 [Linnemannia zychae]